MAEDNTLGARHIASTAAMLYFMFAGCDCVVGNDLRKFFLERGRVRYEEDGCVMQDAVL